MIATTLTPTTTLSCTNNKIRRIARQSRSLQVKASDVDSYGDYDIEQMNTLPAHLAGMNTSNGEASVSSEEFEKLYHWFLS